MSQSALPFVLAAESKAGQPNLEHLSSLTAQRAARFWAGKWTGSQAKAVCLGRVLAAWRDPKRVAEVLAGLRPEQRTVLAVVRRFGGSLSGTLLRREMIARGIVTEPTREDLLHYRRDADPVHDLCENLALVGMGGDYWSFSNTREYANVLLPGHVAPLIQPAAALDWKASAPVEKAPESTTLRAPAQMLLDLEQTARVLRDRDRWKINRGGALAAADRNRLAKSFPPQSSDSFEPPDRLVLNYALLCALGVAELDEAEGWIAPGRLESLARLAPEAQASMWIRAWMTLRTWQDGIGAVPERDTREEPVRIEPGAMRQARELLVWALTRVAHSQNEWLDLETFLLDLYKATGEHGLSFYWQGYAWRPHFAAAAGKDKLPVGFERFRAFWMDDEGIWAANALLSTFVQLGLVERGRSGGARSERWAFRLTKVGTAVFGAPEVQIQKTTESERCLTVQPNHDVLLYLDSADGPAVLTLGRMALRESTTGVVQTFTLTRESVYGALEDGMSPADIESFLSSRSRNGLPANVSHSLAEWSRKREALVVRTAVAVGAALPHGQDALRGRTVGASFVVASPRTAGKGAIDLGIAVESGTASRDWDVDEHGVVSPGQRMGLVGKARLQRFAHFTDGRWRITSESVRAARERGIPTDQILDWLAAHVRHEVPPVLATAIRNWAGEHGRAFLGEVVLLQVTDPQASDALRRSRRLRPFLKGTLAPGCFLVAAEMRTEAADLLRELGFSMDPECQLASGRDAANKSEAPEQTITVLRLAGIGGGQGNRRRTRSAGGPGKR